MKKHGFKLEKVECQSTVDHIPLDGGEILGMWVLTKREQWNGLCGFILQILYHSY